MWRFKIDRNAAVFWVVFLVVYLAFLVLLFPYGAGTIYVNVFITCYICIFAVVLILMIYRRLAGFDVFDPIYFISAIYSLLFFVTPIYDIVRGNYLWFGYDVFTWGTRATIYAFLGYAAFAVIYMVRFRRTDEAPAVREPDPAQEEMGKNLVPVILAMFVFCFIANMYYLTRNGSSWLYVLSLGVFDSGGRAQQVTSDIGFLAMFSYCLPAIVMLYWEYGENRALKILFFALMLVMQVARGFRFFVVQIIITFITFVFLRRNKRPGIGTFMGAALVGIIPIILMTLFRNTLRMGGSVEYSSLFAINIRDSVDEVFWLNFQIYHNFYGLVAKIPSQLPYVFGRQIILGTAIMLIPRIIWPGKLPSAYGEGLDVIIGKRLRYTGQAYPNIGEFYYAFGVAGIIVCMGLYGLWMRSARQRFLNGSRRPLDLIKFSVLLGANLQIIIRGYTPSNFWYVVFSLLPVWIFSLVVYFALEKRRRQQRILESEVT